MAIAVLGGTPMEPMDDLSHQHRLAALRLARHDADGESVHGHLQGNFSMNRLSAATSPAHHSLFVKGTICATQRHTCTLEGNITQTSPL